MTLELPFEREARGRAPAEAPRHGPPEQSTLPVSVVIVTYNSRVFIGECLRSLKEEGRAREVVVVDNASTDGGPAFVESEFPEVRLLRNPKNVGYAAGVNRGLRESRQPFALVLNPDVRVLPGAVEALWRRMEADHAVGIAGPKLLNPDGTLQHSCRRFYTLATFAARRTFLRHLLPLRGVERRHLMADEDHDRPMVVDWVIGAAMLVRREAAEDVGPMDERFFLYFEDVDWCYRMGKRGWHVLYLPEAVMVHNLRRESARRPLGRSLRAHIASSLRFYDKWSGILYLLKRYRARLAGISLLICDVAALTAAFLLSYLARASLASIYERPVFPLEVYTEYMIVVDVVAVVCLYAYGLYRRGRLGDWADRLVEVGKAILTATVIVMALTFLSYRNTFSRWMLAAFAVFATVLVTLVRGALARAYDAAVSQLFARRRLLVLGPAAAVAEARARLERRPEPEYDPLFLVLGGASVTQRPESFLAFLQDERVSDVLLLWSGEWPVEWNEAVPAWMRAGIRVRVRPAFAPLLGGSVRTEEIGGLPALRLDRGARPGLLGIGKRVNDMLVAVVLLVTLAPAAAVVAAVRRARGIPFGVERTRACGPRGTVTVRRLTGVVPPLFASYPGLASVVIGRVALVGLAPLTPEEVEGLPVILRHLHDEAPPGLLGSWERRRRGGPESQRRADLEYVLGWTLVRDWKILVRSVVRSSSPHRPEVPLKPEVT